MQGLVAYFVLIMMWRELANSWASSPQSEDLLQMLGAYPPVRTCLHLAEPVEVLKIEDLGSVFAARDLLFDWLEMGELWPARHTDHVSYWDTLCHDFCFDVSHH